jgi:hypothetical protein
MCVFLYLLESNKQWIQANEICRNKGKTLTPINSIRLPNGIYSSTITMWTPNYVLDIDYIGNIGNLLNVMFLTFYSRLQSQAVAHIKSQIKHVLFI